jgi:hypothetical protein
MTRTMRSIELQEILAESEDEDVRLLAETELFQVNPTTRDFGFWFGEHVPHCPPCESTTRKVENMGCKEDAPITIDSKETASQSKAEARSTTEEDDSRKCARVSGEITVKRASSELVSVTFTIDFAA